MAEALGVAASVFAVIQLADRVLTICRLCIESLKDCPQDLRTILIEISSTRALFDSLQFLQQHNPNSVKFLERLSGPNGAVTGCHIAVQELESLLPWHILTDTQNAKTKRQKAEIVLKMLAWPLKQTRARELLARISQHRNTINTTFSTEIWQDVQTIKQDVTQVQEVLTDSQRHTMLEWLEVDDPSPIHNISSGLVEDGTCDWLIETPEWSQWVNLDSRCLWIHGIPGSGKTVLAARLIEKIRQICAQPRDDRWVSVYYYCHHSRSKDESASFIRWIVSQLCRTAGKIPSCLRGIYQRGGEPTQVEILSCLQQLLEWFDIVFVTIDALDESRPTAPLLALQTLITDSRFSKIRLLATSRQYADIQQAMVGMSLPVSMAHPSVERDIALAVRKMIESNPRFKGWPLNFREEVIGILSRQSEGMFRLAICRLDVLKHAASVEEAVDVLYHLPHSLEDTYTRILTSIAQEDWPLVRHILQMLCFHYWLYDDWDHSRLSHTLILDTYAARSGRTTYFYTLETLQEICGCLVAFSECEEGQSFLTFAHYTLREYLESSRVQMGAAAYFALHGSNKEMIEFIFKQALAASGKKHMAVRNIFDPEEKSIYTLAQSNVDIYAVFSACAVLYDHEDLVAADDKLSGFAYQLLNPRSPNFEIRNEMMRKLLVGDKYMFRDAVGFGQRFWDIEWDPAPTPPDAGLLTLLLWSAFFKLAERLQRDVQPRVVAGTELSLRATICEAFRLVQTNEFRGTIWEFFKENEDHLQWGPKIVSLLTVWLDTSRGV